MPPCSVQRGIYTARFTPSESPCAPVYHKADKERPSRSRTYSLHGPALWKKSEWYMNSWLEGSQFEMARLCFPARDSCRSDEVVYYECIPRMRVPCSISQDDAPPLEPTVDILPTLVHNRSLPAHHHCQQSAGDAADATHHAVSTPHHRQIEQVRAPDQPAQL